MTADDRRAAARIVRGSTATRRPSWLPYAGLLLLIVVAHGPLRHGEYVQDDELAVERNEIVESGGLGEIFGTSYWEGARGADRTLYRPVVIASYAIERRVVGEPRAAVSRGINVALHALVVVLLVGLARRLGFDERATLAAAALFALHPIHVEAIANVVGRAELIAAAGSLVALLASSRAVEGFGAATRHPRAYGWLAALALFVALGAKEVAIATPLLMAALLALYAPPGALRERQGWIERAGALAPSALAAVVYLILRVRALETLVSLQRVHPLDNPLVDLVGVERAATALALIARYAGLLFYPIELSIDYSGSVIAVEPSLFRPLPLIGLALLLAGLAPAVAAFLALSRGSLTPTLRTAGFAALALALPYAVIGNLFVIVGAGIAERFMYMPSLGFCLLAGLGLAALSRLIPDPRGRMAFLAILAVLVAAFSLRSFARSLEWKDNLTIFRAAARAKPESPRAHFVVGKLTLDGGDPAGAIEHLDRTLAARPDHPTAWMEKGNALGALGRFAEAEGMFRKTLEQAPSYATAHRNLALALRRQGKLDQAERALRKAAVLHPESATTWAELGNLYLQQRRFGESASAYRRAIDLGREDLGDRLILAERGVAASRGSTGRE